jgi:hypothetical protein
MSLTNQQVDDGQPNWKGRDNERTENRGRGALVTGANRGIGRFSVR